ncbi:MAG: glutamate--tRNA ligase [Planctomycetes bacterium]|nr:glutamate--tRNA ligase [Planctomycetota bacterium]
MDESRLRGARVRFAPSPTGYLHIGGARTALFNWLVARRYGGTFILRLEDTDRVRDVKGAREAIYEGLRWLGLDPDEGPEQGGPYGPYCQSERGEIYAHAIAELRERGAIYPCFYTREELAAQRAAAEARGEVWRYDGKYRELAPSLAKARIDRGEEHTWRLKVNAGATRYHDLVLGDSEVKNDDVEDIILVRGNGEPVYNLVVVIDDHHMRVSHVLRGADHQTNTFKQLQIYLGLGWTPPEFGHIPLILAEPPNKGKMSKRHGGATVEEYQKAGYDVEAMINWLALMGWSLDGETEVISRADLVKNFDISRIGKTGAQLNRPKLEWISGEYLRRQSPQQLAPRVARALAERGWIPAAEIDSPSARTMRITTALRERMRKDGDVAPLCTWIFTADLPFEEKAQQTLVKDPENAARLERLAAALPDALPDGEAFSELMKRVAAELGVGFGKIASPARAALTGGLSGFELVDCFHVLGATESVRRLRAGAARCRSAQSASS